MQHEGRTFVLCSANGCWGPNYKLGVLTLSGRDPLAPSACSDIPSRCASARTAQSAFGPGHHARRYRDRSPAGE